MKARLFYVRIHPQRGCRITAITLASQARDEGSTPSTRSILRGFDDLKSISWFRDNAVSETVSETMAFAASIPYLHHVSRHLHREFPRLPSYQRCVELLPR
jgi:hypothetical protein